MILKRSPQAMAQICRILCVHLHSAKLWMQNAITRAARAYTLIPDKRSAMQPFNSTYTYNGPIRIRN
ncbi:MULTISPECIES: hypothetical protein [Chryseobacterium]|uniref:Uncharacterized protein n=1 Tax=Chryseobacterium camelliae TaxID=1265445 RepID=A0ABU0TFR9_9FLAO|nr:MULTISPECIES: hypothetical protein [Chryseobacterium]MDT3406389.1 hypothetical protein [Pseudacidovorax intermedius]MDQ1095811.1 hypothetical protein [Chryseobacterium camelliae]MDQ1099748.1 hypothetical protein [Chryseobacterium sp. SORGH_AS_1048]MDR6087096.1 hypothetical protein [Chryseobacterium sp. SORGH_AS_0909]MDR6131469.1 hypothetical protein [Chryseobacterium sp. SORGH_AS_1175]